MGTANVVRMVCPTARVSGGGWEGGLALETEKAQSHENAQKTRRVPTRQVHALLARALCFEYDA